MLDCSSDSDLLRGPHRIERRFPLGLLIDVYYPVLSWSCGNVCLHCPVRHKKAVIRRGLSGLVAVLHLMGSTLFVHVT